MTVSISYLIIFYQIEYIFENMLIIYNKGNENLKKWFHGTDAPHLFLQIGMIQGKIGD